MNAGLADFQIKFCPAPYDIPAENNKLLQKLFQRKCFWLSAVFHKRQRIKMVGAFKVRMFVKIIQNFLRIGFSF